MYRPEILEKIKALETPFYCYDMNLLNMTVDSVLEYKQNNFDIHFALKANSNNEILRHICQKGLGADCVSGNEIKKAIENGFKGKNIVFAGVGKSDIEIETAIKNEIFCFNCESIQELSIINSFANKHNKIVKIALRINPNIDAKTHHYITTGLSENKFGISRNELNEILDNRDTFENIKISGLHFHIGSQIIDLEVYKSLCIRINEFQSWFLDRNIEFDFINVGGGLGVDYVNVDENPIPDFKSYFNVFKQFLEIRINQKIHFELGRSIVANCGSLISKVLFVKKGDSKIFVVLDAGMTDLIRPALYQSYHKIENITSDKDEEIYDVVGPICESSDIFGKSVKLSQTKRGDQIAIRSTGAYGEVMTSNYNLREKPQSYFF